MRTAVLGARIGVVQKTVWLACGWVLVAIGVVLLPAPVPVPLIGVMPILVGLAILTTHSKPVRRRLQYARHRFEWLSRTFERFAHRAPQMVKHMIRRTNPIAHVRLARMRAHRRH
jgi:hypothetical protein